MKLTVLIYAVATVVGTLQAAPIRETYSEFKELSCYYAEGTCYDSYDILVPNGYRATVNSLWLNIVFETNYWIENFFSEEDVTVTGNAGYTAATDFGNTWLACEGSDSRTMTLAFEASDYLDINFDCQQSLGRTPLAREFHGSIVPFTLDVSGWQSLDGDARGCKRFCVNLF